MEVFRSNLTKLTKTLFKRAYVASQISRSYGTATLEEKIIKSPAPFLQLTKGNFLDLLLKDVSKWQNKVFMECAATGKTLTFTQLQEKSERWSEFIRTVGVSKGDVIAIISPNCVNYAPIFLGTAAVGAILSPINSTSTAEEIKRIIEISQPKIMVFSKETKDCAVEALTKYGKNVLMASLESRRDPTIISVDDIFDAQLGASTSSSEKLTGEESLCMLFSSGTTGPPKGVSISHNAWKAAVLQILNPYHQLYLDKPEVTLAVLPFSHVYGLAGILAMGVVTGSKIVVIPKFKPQLFIDMIVKHKVTLLHTVPTLLNLLANSPECNPSHMSSLSTVVCGAAPVHESTANMFKQKIKKEIMFFEGYGLTETSIITLTPRKFPRLGSCGQLVSNVEAKVINPDTGECLGPNQNGEICVKTPGLMKEYARNPEATSAILKDGWLHTGDVGFYDTDGFFSIVDRTKDLIKVQGLQVSPTEIEDELLKHPSVTECSVVGVPDQKTGEAPKAFVILKEKATVDDLQKFLAPRLSKHKQLRGGITFVESLPKSESGKVLRKVLRTMT